MNVLKNFLWKIGNFILSIIRVLRKAICCRKKKDADYLLPLHVTGTTSHEMPLNCNFESQWEVWPSTNKTSLSTSSNLNSKSETELSEQDNELNSDDYFKDMVPQIRKTKKLLIRQETVEREERLTSNRLAMDPKAILTGDDLGIMEENPTNWEDCNADELFDPNELIRETKRAEREKRFAEHQRRKQEREQKRAMKQDMPGSLATLTATDRAKFS